MLMKNKINDIINNLDFKTKVIIKNGFKFCTFLCAISLFLLVTYIFWFSIPLVFNIGIMIFEMSLLFSVEFLVCGIVVDSLKKRLI